MSELKRKATRLLRKYDKMRAEMRTLEHELARACADYGRATGRWGWNRDYMRSELEREEREKEQAA